VGWHWQEEPTLQENFVNGWLNVACSAQASRRKQEKAEIDRVILIGIKKASIGFDRWRFDIMVASRSIPVGR
jgi:hypothetical protein